VFGGRGGEQGGWSNAETDKDRTLYVDLARVEFLPRALWLEADRMAGLADVLDQASLDNQRDVVLNERRETHENRPYGMAEILVNQALWPAAHPYHAPVIGYVDDLRAATVYDARAFFKTWYAPANALLVVAGDFDVAQARRWVEADFGWIPGGAAPARRLAPDPAPLGGQVDVSAEDEVQVPRVYVTWRGARAASSDEAALELAAAMLAGGKSSRL